LHTTSEATARALLVLGKVVRITPSPLSLITGAIFSITQHIVGIERACRDALAHPAALAAAAALAGRPLLSSMSIDGAHDFDEMKKEEAPAKKDLKYWTVGNYDWKYLCTPEVGSAGRAAILLG
jgi:hypothetical protein